MIVSLTIQPVRVYQPLHLFGNGPSGITDEDAAPLGFVNGGVMMRAEGIAE